MRLEKQEKQKFHGRFGESGHYYFSLTQTDNRFALCRACLRFDAKVTIKFKRIYGSMLDVERCSIVKYENLKQLTERYQAIDELAFGGEFYRYDKEYCPEGAFFPFIRATGKTRLEIIDTGCIWLGTKFEYPRVFVDNDVANWLSGYSPGGYPRIKPFLPYDKVIDILPKLMHKKNYSDIELDSII
jgi:hypothetical protein